MKRKFDHAQTVHYLYKNKAEMSIIKVITETAVIRYTEASSPEQIPVVDKLHIIYQLESGHNFEESLLFETKQDLKDSL